MTAPHATPRARAKLPQLEPAARRLDTVGFGRSHACSANARRASSSGPVATNEQKAHRSTTLASGNITMPPKFVHRRSSDLLNLSTVCSGDGTDGAPGRRMVDRDARGSGIVGLNDRVEALGGSLHVDSSPGEGTQIVAQLPLDLDLRIRGKTAQERLCG